MSNTPNNTADLAALQAQAQRGIEQSRNEFMDRIEKWDLSSNNPAAIAILLSKLPIAGGNYLPPPQCLALALSAYKYDADPFVGEIFITPNGKIGFTVEFKMKFAARQYKIGVPKYESLERPWVTPDNEIAKMLKLPTDMGCRCSLTVEGFKEPVIGEAWLSEWFMPKNPNWVNRWRGLMLPTRARGLAVESLTGLGSSSDHSETELGELAMETETKTEPVKPKVSAPKTETVI